MAEAHLTNDEFFTKLANLFEYNRNKGHGTIHLTQKRLTYGNVEEKRTAYDNLEQPSETSQRDDVLWDLHPEHPVPVIIRAQNNKSSKREGKDRPGCERENIDKIKLSTVVQPDQLDAFYARYAEACKAGMGALKKRDRKKGKKDKKKKKVTGETKG